MNTLTMRPRELADLLRTTIPAKLPILIKGAPGIGKSDIVAQAAAATGAKLILMHPVVSDPLDFKGLPAVVKIQGGEERAVFLPYSELLELISAKELTVCFLDDLGQAPAAVQAAAMQLLRARRVNGHRVSDEVVFVAATNRREDKAGVTGVLEPVKSRFATIVELGVHVDDWCRWAIDAGVPAEVIAFIRFRPELLMAAGTPTNDIVNRPSPRTVWHFGDLFKLGVRSLAVLAGAAGEGFATEFLGFLRIWEQLPSIEGIFEDPLGAAVPNNPAALYAVSTALATRVTRETAGAVVKYATRMPEEFTVLTIRDCQQRCPAATGCKEFIQWVVQHQNLLI